MKNVRWILKIWVLLAAVLLPAAVVPPAAGGELTREVLSAAEIISSINAYRVQSGLPAYETNSKLMAAAQAQSDYQASIGSVTHTGPGGNRPRDRAYAVGYGDGNSVWISEIIYGGINATVGTAVGWWKTSTVHNNTMLSTQYRDIGAGVATAGGMVYYTAVTGYITGSAAPEGTAGSGSEPQVQAPLVIPVVPAEPQEDGSIVHIIRTGQSLWNIAAVYDVPLERILELNDLAENSMLQLGQEILVMTPSEAAARITPSAEPALEVTEVPAEETAEPSPTPTTTATPRAETPEPVEPEPTTVPDAALEGVDPVGDSPEVGTILAFSVVAVFFALAGLSFTRVDPREH
jgi:LysM repeat protein